jgi:type III restriction enzyme
VRIHVQSPAGPKEKSVTVKGGADLFALSNERAAYAQGFSVAEISAEPGGEFVRFSGGRTLRLGEEIGGMRDDIWRAQIKHTVKRHLTKELELRGRGIKVLSLFFVDRVANYRDYDDEGRPTKGRFAEAFEAELSALAREESYRDFDWLSLPLDRLHNGYFAQDKKGVLKDTRGDTQADDDVYNLIMKEKERLLSLDEPLRFIFSHSALREGWDNPNVFQICTLNETRSAVKKRQEIGRGLRLPVDQNGLRVFDESVNRLYVMANESHDDFARALQTEYEEECGVAFGTVPLTALARLTTVVDDHERPIGREAAETIRAALVEQGMLDGGGRIQPGFAPQRPGFSLQLPEPHRDHRADACMRLSTPRMLATVTAGSDFKSRPNGVAHDARA